MEKNSFEYYVERYIDGKITADEWTVLRQMMEVPGNEEYLNELMSKQLEDSTSLSDAFPAVTDRILSSVEGKISHTSAVAVRPAHRIHFLRSAWFRYAAAILILFGTAAYFWINSGKKKEVATITGTKRQPDVAPGGDRAILTLANGQKIVLDSTQGNIVKQGDLIVVNLGGKLKYEGLGTQVEYHTISTPKGGQYQIVLPDGSRVWLNAASSIKFPTSFIGNTRNVEMTGEAYMEIANNAKQSFVLMAKGAQIQVLGTSLNVNAYQNESAVKTTLITGSVKVLSGADPSAGNQINGTGSSGLAGSQATLNAIILKPGQQAVITDRNPDQVKVQAADIEQALDWKNGILNFNGADLETVMRQLERWYSIQVRYQGEVPKIIFKGKMYRNVDFSDVLDMLKRMGVRYKLEGKTLIVI